MLEINLVITNTIYVYYTIKFFILNQYKIRILIIINIVGTVSVKTYFVYIHFHKKQCKKDGQKGKSTQKILKGVK